MLIIFLELVNTSRKGKNVFPFISYDIFRYEFKIDLLDEKLIYFIFLITLHLLLISRKLFISLYVHFNNLLFATLYYLVYDFVHDYL